MFLVNRQKMNDLLSVTFDVQVPICYVKETALGSFI